MEQSLLIVDDDVPFRNRLAYSMEKKGFVVEVFSKATEAKERLKEKLKMAIMKKSKALKKLILLTIYI